MIYIGSHLSVSDGYEAMAETMERWGGSTYAFFTRNPRGGTSKEPPQEDVAGMLSRTERAGFGPLVAHGAYIMNLCAARPEVAEKSGQMLASDLVLMERLPGCFYNFHPGSHVGQGSREGIRKIADALNRCMRPDQKTTVLLETMSGKGSEVGGTFEELAEILGLLEVPEKAGVCLDTCHVWDAGYDIVSDLDGVIDAFSRVIGLERLCAVHLNDSKNPCGSHKDRHEKLGQGAIGEAALKAVVRHPALQGLPFILETPNDDEGYIREIALVKEWMA